MKKAMVATRHCRFAMFRMADVNDEIQNISRCMEMKISGFEIPFDGVQVMIILAQLSATNPRGNQADLKTSIPPLS